VRAGWGLGLVGLVASVGLLSGMAVGTAPGGRAVAVEALGALPAPLRPADLVLPGAPAPARAAPPLPAPDVAEPDTAVPDSAPSGAAPLDSPVPVAPNPGTPNTDPTGAALPCAPTARACVDLTGNRSWLLDEGRVAYGPVPITHGRPGFRTPSGTFRVASKKRDHVSSIYDADMPWSVFFNRGIAFHEGSLSVASHGCIHLSPEAAEAYFTALSVGDVVEVVP